MGKVEIKIRKKILTPDNLQQYRDYPALLKKYERNKRFKRALRIFIYSLGLTMFVLALIFLGMWKVLEDKKREKINPEKAFLYLLKSPRNLSDTVLMELTSKSENDSMHIITYNSEKQITYQFPIDSSYNSFTNCKFIDSKLFNINGKNYTVIEYRIDDPKYLDDETYYFYSPDFGILHTQSMMWASKTLISVNHIEKDLIIKELVRSIQEKQNLDFE